MCQGVGHDFGWGAPVECFAWFVVVNVGDHLQVLGAVDGQVAVFGKVSPEPAVGVFVAAAFPR